MPIEYVEVPVEPSMTSDYLRGIRFVAQCVVVPPIVPPPPISIRPETDTIRGGKEITFYNGGALSGSTQTLLSPTLPTGWTTTITGMGASLAANSQGALLQTGTATAASATLNIPTTLTHFDIALDVNLESSFSVSANSSQDLCAIEFTAPSFSILRLAVVANRLLSATNPVIILTYTVGSRIVAGGFLILDSFPTTLRLIKYTSLVWAFIGSRSGTYLDKWTGLLPVGSLTGSSESGTISISARNYTSGVGAATRITNYTSRAHAVIDNRLVEDKHIVAPARMLATVPATNLEAVGSRDMFVFGEGVGTSGLTQGEFVYTLPAPFTVGNRSSDRARFYGDKALRDQ